VARIAGVSARDARLSVKLAYFFTRRVIGRLSRRMPDRMIEPVELLAHIPGVGAIPSSVSITSSCSMDASRRPRRRGTVFPEETTTRRGGASCRMKMGVV
jgi:hypothetical protein